MSRGVMTITCPDCGTVFHDDKLRVFCEPCGERWAALAREDAWSEDEEEAYAVGEALAYHRDNDLDLSAQNAGGQ